MCSYREKKSEPQELLQLDGYTVDYTDPQPGKTQTFIPLHNMPLLFTIAIGIVMANEYHLLSLPTSTDDPKLGLLKVKLIIFPLFTGLDGGRAFFNAVKEGDTVIFASDDEQDRILWVQAMYRATGQSHKPVPPTQVQKLNSKGGASAQMDAPISQFCK